MVEISRNTGSYAIIASASLRPNAEALNRLSQVTGSSVTTTQTSLRGQLGDITRFVENVSVEAEAVASLETTRGLKRSSDISQTVADALNGVRQRIGYTDALNATRSTTAASYNRNTGALALLSSIEGGPDDFNFAILFSKPPRKVVPDKITTSSAQQPKGDPFDRGIPVTATTGGTGSISIERTALSAQGVNVLLDKSTPSLGGIRAAGYVPSGSFREDNDAFYVKSSTGDGDDTIVFDTRDPTKEDSRLVSINLDTGAGSDVIFIAGDNTSRINAGAGDDFVAAEGDAIVDGGDGNDLIYARTASGDAGDDVIFSDGFASGGDGNDSITLFSLDPAGDTAPKVAYGGAGDDQIVASVRANIDGGSGDDVLILRDGGTAGGGSGNDTISSWEKATVEGGEGDDDILLLQGGAADGGAGNDTINASTYSVVSGGTGNDTVSLDRGGVYNFAKGDGSDKLNLRQAIAGFDDVNKQPVNRIVLDNYDVSEISLNLTATSLQLSASGVGANGDNILVDREILGKIEITFRKNGAEQVLKIDGLTQTMGPKTYPPV
jgi:Ca2+-binding RTX toxin-like protein